MKKFTDYSDIDIISLLDDQNIEYRESGKNIGSNFIGVETCPFCNSGGFHLGVSKSNKIFNCWVCGEKGNLFKLLKNLLDLDNSEIGKLLNKFGGHFTKVEEQVLSSKIIFPTHLTKLTNPGKQYLINRGFSPSIIQKKCSVKQTGMLSTLRVGEKSYDIRYRILIPINDRNGICKNWIARDYTGESNIRYKNAPMECSTSPLGELLYGIDKFKGKQVIICEGVFDKIRLGDSALALFGVKFSTSQIRALVGLNLDQAIVLFDQNAEKTSVSLSNTLQPFIKTTSFTLKKGDPADLSEVESQKLVYYLLNGN